MKKAFSLLELSVSIAVISLLMAIVSQSVKLVSSSKLTNARTITSSAPIPSIPGLVAWYESSSVDSFKENEAVNGKQITAWYDISPESIDEKKNTLTRTASAAVTYELKGINDIPSVKFNGTGILNLASFYQGISAQNTIFFVARPYSIGPGVAVIDSGPTATQNSTVTLNSAGIYAFWGSNSQITDASCCAINKDYIIAFYANRSASKGYINNTSTIAGGNTINPGNGSLIGLTVGAGYTNISNFSGLISEVIIYNRPLKDLERKEVMRYLSKKYEIKVTGT
jgi:prepilin-type N-terminal cleavage/methylation domain-containing protein